MKIQLYLRLSPKSKIRAKLKQRVEETHRAKSPVRSACEEGELASRTQKEGDARFMTAKWKNQGCTDDVFGREGGPL